MSKELDYILDHIADLERGNMALRSLLYCTKRSCNNCGKVNCENFQRQRIDCCGLWVSYKDYINKLEKEYKLLGERCNQLLKDKGDLTDELAKWKEEWQEQVQKATDEGWERTKLTGKVRELEQQIEKMKRHCNCKHRDSEGYCEVKRTYLIDLSYDGCDKWELEDCTKECEMKKIMEQANEGLDFDKIADEVEQDIKEQEE